MAASQVTLRRIYHYLLRTPARMLHPSRRYLAVRRQAGARPPSNVLVLCYGNICRSPYAERHLSRILTSRGRPDIPVKSAGFFGAGRPANETALATAMKRGVDLSDHQSQVVDANSIARATLVLVMSRRQARDARRLGGPHGPPVEILGDFDPEKASDREIPDPYGKDQDEFSRVFDRIERCLGLLVRTWQI